MILGVLDRDRLNIELKRHLFQAVEHLDHSKTNLQPVFWGTQRLAICSTPTLISTLDEYPQPFMNEDQSIFMIFEGKVYNAEALRSFLEGEHRFNTDCSGEALIHLYEKYQQDFLDKVNGKFVFALWDERNQKLILGRDRFGIQPLFYFNGGKRFIFSSSLKTLLETGWISRQLNHQALLQYLLFCYNPGDETFLQNVYKLPGGHILSVRDSGTSLKKYWHLSFSETLKAEEQYRKEILNLIEDSIRIRMEPDNIPGVLLSGGTDSSTIVSLASRISRGPIHTFSFRCEGRSYDESRYARYVAERYNTQHTEIPYGPEDLFLISRAVESMDEPFCDIGIEIGTYLLGRAAQNKVSYVLSGEGGDELFGGHPVYIADKVATVVDRFPRPLLCPLVKVLQKIPDSDQKKNFQVKIKRFAYSLSFPPQLLSHRWRIYYTPKELQELCTEDFFEYCHIQKMYDSILKYNSDADGHDQLSRSLYSDYQTLVNFYLRRLGLLRAFSIENRLPLLDHRLVEYAAKIPSQLKIRGLSDTKYIYKKILEEVLPREILYERPKLGHSVPMKNWLRENKKVRKWIEETFSNESFVNRSLFRTDYVRRIIDEHLKKDHNHSHRLWGLLVLEIWLRAWLDR
ncbi:MAG: asparagine synthase (glutamine-hydrolyzing) [Nitrospirota bacterium]